MAVIENRKRNIFYSAWKGTVIFTFCKLYKCLYLPFTPFFRWIHLLGRGGFFFWNFNDLVFWTLVSSLLFVDHIFFTICAPSRCAWRRSSCHPTRRQCSWTTRSWPSRPSCRNSASSTSSSSSAASALLQDLGLFSTKSLAGRQPRALARR